MSMIGKTLGNFECTALLGKGGMGEVYQAKDQKLGRNVAIKVLPEEFARDADRVARFQREAKLLASLNHPNIAAIHGLEESDGTHFLVLELVEGNTLADRIKHGAVPVEESLKLALQIAEALEAAHEKGVIHRDLKPANIKVTSDGKVKVLDFGLAKAFAGDQEDMNLSNSPTLSVAATQQGIILGTAPYMSPEQARGKSVDKKTDIWAFGCVLYEMLTGKAAFQGEDITEVLAAVVKSGVNLDLLPANIHTRIREVINRCLQKEQKKRYPEISQAQYEIEQVLADPGGVFVSAVPTAKARKRPRFGLSWVVAALVFGLIMAGLAVWYFKPSEPPRIVSFDYDLPEGQELNVSTAMPGHTLAVSPDGSQFIYSTSQGLYLRSEDELEARLIPGTNDNPQSPFFSPDGQSAGYWSQADNKLKTIPIGGGAPVSLCDVTWLWGADWYSDNTIVYADALSGIKRISANGGTPETLVEGVCVAPQILPDGKSVIYTEGPAQPYRIVAQSLESGERKELFAGEFARYLPTGHLVYSFENNLYAVPFDPVTLKETGGRATIVEGVFVFFAISDSGTLVYIPGTTGTSSGAPLPQRTLVWVDREGNEEPLNAPPNMYNSPKISPDGTKVALVSGPEGNTDIWIWDLVRKTMPKLTFDETDDSYPLWTPDGQRIVFHSLREEVLGGIYWKAADNTGAVEKLISVPDRMIGPASWSSDGNTLVLQEITLAPLGTDIGMLTMEGDRERKVLLQEKHSELLPQVSPDGRWIAYQSDKTGQSEIYVRPFPDVESGGQHLVSNSGGNSPLWSPDGRELFYRNGDATMAVPVETEPTFIPGNPKILFQGKYLSDISPLGEQTPWDIHPDGERFLLIKRPQTSAGEITSTIPRQINIVLNWFEELKQRVPVE